MAPILSVLKKYLYVQHLWIHNLTLKLPCAKSGIGLDLHVSVLNQGILQFYDHKS